MSIHDTRSGPPSVTASWQGILNAIPAGACICDSAGLITYFNSLAEAVWGRAPKLRNPADRYCGSFKLYSGDGTPIRHDECWMALALREGREYNGREIQIERPDQSRRFGMAYAHPLRNAEGRTIGAVNLFADITAQKKLETDRKKNQPIMPTYHDATLAMIEVGVSALAGMTWATSTFG